MDEEIKVSKRSRMATSIKIMAVFSAVLILTFSIRLISSSVPSQAGNQKNLSSSSITTVKTKQTYVVLAWNDLGMHCYNPDYQDLCILPPYNTLWAQVIKVGDLPQIITSGITVSYSVPGNTYSADKFPFPAKTNFWQYVKSLFNMSLQKNIGLAGKGLAGQMDPEGDHFIAKGIPLTEYTDKGAQNPDPSKWTPNHFQLALIIVKNSTTGMELARIQTVAPVSTELDCINCHSDDGDATTRYPITPTGKVETNVLAMHDYINSETFSAMNLPLLMDSRPVLCAGCHADNALGTIGMEGVKNLSNAMHGHHNRADIMDITPDTDGCYQCHPGPQTQCLRDTMSQHFAIGCVDCHGTIANVSQNNNPWLNEPSCDNSNCHGAGYSLSQPLYRFSIGHGGVYCEGCHDSTHAITPSRVVEDDVKFVTLQGEPGTLRDCTVCHSSQSLSAFHHRYVPST